MISVILPIYNGAEYLRFAIDSILNQTYKDFELFIVNDGSTDNSIDIIKSYQDSRIRLETQANLGLTKTLNRLVAEARGNLLARMDQDDWSHPDRLRIQVATLEQHPEIVMCGSWIRAIDTSNQVRYTHKYPVTNHAIHEEMLISNPFAHGSIMIRKSPEVFYRTEYNDAEDIDHWARQCMQHQVYNIPQVLYHWRINPAGISHSRAAKQQMAAKRVLEYYRNWYVKNTDGKLPPRNEMRLERELVGWQAIWTRKRQLMKIFFKHHRPELINREWKYILKTLW